MPLVRVRILGAERSGAETGGATAERCCMSRDCSVVVMAAGKGTRMKSAVPKVLHSLCGRTLLGHALATAEGLDPRQIIVVVRHERDLVAAEVGSQAVVADQDEIPGTGRAVQCGLEQAQGDLGRTVVVTSGDVPLLEPSTLVELVEAHEAAGAAVTLMTTIAEDPHGYGRVLRGEDGLVTAIVEEKDATDEQRQVREINAGIYAFETEFLLAALGNLGQDNAQGEMYLTDTVARAVAEGKKALPFVLTDRWQAEGCNDLAQLAQLRQVLTARLCERHLLAGVSIVDPTNIQLDVQVQLEPDCTIEPGTALRGRTVVRTGAVVGPCTTLTDVEVGAGATVPHSVLTATEVPAGQAVAPFTRQVG